MAQRDSHKGKSSIISNIAAGNSLKPFDIKFGAIIFYKKYSENMMDKFTPAGLSSKIYFGDTIKLSFQGVNVCKKLAEKERILQKTNSCWHYTNRDPGQSNLSSCVEGNCLIAI
jgi:hypothetical protein